MNKTRFHRLPRFQWAALAFLAAVLGACSNDEAGLNANDVVRDEIHIDMFSQYWARTSANAEDVLGKDTLVFYDGAETLILRKPSLLKTLPPHKIASLPGQGKQVFYTVERVPETVTCLIKTRGSLTVDTLPPGANNVYSRHQVAEDYEYNEYFNLKVADAEKWTETAGYGCGAYYPGKGFLVYSGSDVIGEVIIRY